MLELLDRLLENDEDGLDEENEERLLLTDDELPRANRSALTRSSPHSRMGRKRFTKTSLMKKAVPTVSMGTSRLLTLRRGRADFLLFSKDLRQTHAGHVEKILKRGHRLHQSGQKSGR